jgi:hypothetical protein
MHAQLPELWEAKQLVEAKSIHYYGFWFAITFLSSRFIILTIISTIITKILWIDGHIDGSFYLFPFQGKTTFYFDCNIPKISNPYC